MIKNKLYNIVNAGFLILFSWIFISFFIYSDYSILKCNPIFSFLLGTLIIGVWLFVYRFLLKNYDNISVKKEMIIFSIVIILMLLFQISVNKNLLNNPSWDFGVVFNHAKSYVETGMLNNDYRIYFQYFPNNIMLFVFEVIIMKFGVLFGFKDYQFMCLVANAIFVLSSIVLLYLAMRKLFNKRVAMMSLIISFSTLALFLYSPIYYTDTFSLFIPILAIYAYSFVNKNEIGRKKNLIVFIFLGLLAFLAYKLKATAIFIIGAIFIDIFLSTKIRYSAKFILSSIIAFLIGLVLFDTVIVNNKNLGFKVNDFGSYPASTYILMGITDPDMQQMALNNFQFGGWNETDHSKVISFQDNKEADQYNKSLIEERLKRYGFVNYISYLSKKNVVTWGDGSYYAPIKLSISQKKQDNNFYQQLFLGNGKYYSIYSYYASGIQYAIIMLLIIGAILSYRVENKKYSYIRISLILLMLFLCIWETRSRYIFNYIPIFIFLISFTLQDINLLKRQKVSIYQKKTRKININNPKKVSAVIPNYNYARYLIERIDSILLQSYPIYELIILDDKSKDNSVEVIRKKIEQIKIDYPDVIVKFIENEENSGNVFKQWKKAFESASGDYIWIAEADDSCAPTFLETVMESFNHNKVIISYTESLTIDEKNKILMPDLRPWIDIFHTGHWDKSYILNGKEELENVLCINNTIANVSGVVFKNDTEIPYTEYLDSARQYHLAGDWYFYSRVLEHGAIAYHSESLNYHRMHGNSVTLTTKKEKEYAEICSIQDSIMERHKLKKEIKQLVFERRNSVRLRFGLSKEEIELSHLDINSIISKNNLQEKVLLSIIIPVYNTEVYLRKCLDSALEKIPPQTEIIIINDGSPDNSETIIKEYKSKYSDIIRYYKKENGGLSHTKNFGLRKARGKYLIYLDSDDTVSPNMYDVMLKKALLEDADIVYCDFDIVYEDGRTVFFSTTNWERQDQLMSEIDTPYLPSSGNKLVKKELFEGLEYPVKWNNEDVAVTPVLFARSKCTVKINSPFYKYLQRTGSIQNSGFNEKRFQIFHTAEICFDSLKEFDLDVQQKIKGAIYTHQILALLYYLIIREKKKKRLIYLTAFCKHLNRFKDIYHNPYVLEYVKGLDVEQSLIMLEKQDVKKLNHYLQKKKVWNKIKDFV